MRYASVTSGASIPSKIIIHTLSVLPSSPVWFLRVNPTLISVGRYKWIYTMIHWSLKTRNANLCLQQIISKMKCEMRDKFKMPHIIYFKSLIDTYSPSSSEIVTIVLLVAPSTAPFGWFRLLITGCVSERYTTSWPSTSSSYSIIKSISTAPWNVLLRNVRSWRPML